MGDAAPQALVRLPNLTYFLNYDDICIYNNITLCIRFGAVFMAIIYKCHSWEALKTNNGSLFYMHRDHSASNDVFGLLI